MPPTNLSSTDLIADIFSKPHSWAKGHTQSTPPRLQKLATAYVIHILFRGSNAYYA